MKYTLIVKPEAELDTMKATKWYEDKQENLGIRFLDEIEEKLLLIAKNPLHYQIRYKDIRMALIEHFPYAIHFLVQDENIIVISVLGTRENFENWQ